MADEGLRERLAKEIGRCTRSRGRLYSRTGKTREWKYRDYCTYFDSSFSQAYPFRCPHLSELLEIEVPSGMGTTFIEFYRCKINDQRA